MNVRTKVNSSHLVRLAIIGFACIGVMFWSLYDGLVGWPNQQLRAAEFIQFTEENKALDPKDIADKWKVYAAEKGWPTENPGEPKSEFDIFGQFVMAGVTGLIGLFFLVQLIVWRGRWIESNDDTITSNRGHEFQLEHIVELDKKKWNKKGIAYIKFQSDNGSGRLALDDCNYERTSTQEILRHIEANIDLSKLVNGKPEPPLESEGEAVSADETA